LLIIFFNIIWYLLSIALHYAWDLMIIDERFLKRLDEEELHKLKSEIFKQLKARGENKK